MTRERGSLGLASAGGIFFFSLGLYGLSDPSLNQ